MVQGRGVDASLNELGKLQAEKAGEMLRKMSFDQVYASSLVRTHETLAPITSNFIADDGFDEISWGDQEGVVPTEGAKNMYLDTVTQWRSGNLELNLGGGESPIQVMERQKNSLQKLLAKPDQQILICMHGRAMRILLCWALNYPLNYMDGFPHENCSIYSLALQGGTFSIMDFNRTSHLNG